MNKKQSFTPGPWRAEKTVDMGWAIWDGLSRYIAFTGAVEDMDQRPGSPQTESCKKANARLMASAPELLEAVRALLEMRTDNRTHGKEIDQAVSAISKAEGGNP